MSLPRRPSHLGSLLRLLLQQWKPMLVGIGALLVVDTLTMVVPKVTQYVVDGLAAGTATRYKLLLMGLAIVSTAVGMGVCRFFWRYLLIGSSHRIERDLRQRLYDHLQTLPPQYFDHHKVGDIMSHATNDTHAVRRAIGFATLSAFDSAFLMIATLIMMCSFSIKLTLITLIPLPLLALVMMRFGRIIHDRYERVQEAFSSMTEKAQETFSGIRVVKAYGGEQAEFEHFAARAASYVRENIALARIDAIFDPLIGGLALSSIVLLLYFGGRMVVTGGITLGQFVAFGSYLHMLVWPMIAVGMVVNLLQRGAASMGRLQAILDTKPAIADGTGAAADMASLEFRQATFTYPKTEAVVLRDVSFSLPAGCTLGVVGRTGCGKTTMVELLMRLYEPHAGTVLVGGRDVTAMPLADLRGMFGYVPQEPFLFAMSVADNIRFGNRDLPMDAVIELAKQVKMHEEILGFPQGYETLVGERGITLSGGQKQRVAIARALALRPSILILDDALSAVDAETEAAILDHIAETTRSLTGIVIAHRISAVKHASQIVVLDQGAVIDRGTHAELVAREGYYADVYRLQSLEEAELRSARGEDAGKGD